MPASRFANVLPKRIAALELLGYLFASTMALGLDTSTYAAALALGLPLAASAALGFALGVTCAYVCSVRLIFQTHRLKDRSSEFAVFVAIGLAGLLLTEGQLWLLVSCLHLPPLPAKLITAGFIFFFNFCLRKTLLFSPARLRDEPDSRMEPLL